MKKLFTLICLCVLAASTSWAQQLYTTFKYGTLNYYYDDQMDSRSGEKEVYDQSAGLSISYKKDVLEANITPSMKDAPLTSTDRMFYGLQNMTSIHGLENLNTTNVTNMSRMFYNCNCLTSLDLSSFNTANVTNMAAMFCFCNALWSLDVSSFNTANVTSMGSMFSNCYALKTLDVSSFNTQNVTSMVDMFGGCSGLTSLDLSSFNTENVTSMGAMFSGCSHLTSLDLSSFNTENVTDMEKMFSKCNGLTSLDVSSFNTEKVTNMDRMFSYCESLTSLDLSSFNTQKVTEMVEMFSRCPSLRTIFCNDDWGKSSVLEYSKDMFFQCGSLVGGKGTKWTSDIIDARYARPDGGTSKPGYFTWNGAEVYTEFVEATGTLTYYYDDKKASRTGVTEVYDPEDHDALRFKGYYKKVTKAVIDPSMKKAHLTSTYSMFHGGVSQDPSGIYALENMTKIEGLENLSTSTVTDMKSMFSGCYALTSLDLSSFNTSAVTNMNGMFSMCQALTQLDLSSFNTSNVKDFNGMFMFCNKLKMIDVNSFDISKATKMDYMFSYCGELTTIYCDKDWSSTSASSEYMFSTSRKLVGGKGTAYDSNFLDKTYARPDGGTASPGYFTEDTMTGLQSIHNSQFTIHNEEGAAIYNLAGQKMVNDKWSNTKLPRGIYIKDGKKIIRE